MPGANLLKKRFINGLNNIINPMLTHFYIVVYLMVMIHFLNQIKIVSLQKKSKPDEHYPC